MPDNAPSEKPRTKHAQLARPHGGEFGRHELAILGAPCGRIKERHPGTLPPHGCQG